MTEGLESPPNGIIGCPRGSACTAHTPTPLPRNQYCFAADQQVVLGQCFQAKKCPETRGSLLRMAMSSPPPW